MISLYLLHKSEFQIGIVLPSPLQLQCSFQQIFSHIALAFCSCVKSPLFSFHLFISVPRLWPSLPECTSDSGDSLIQGAVGCHITNPRTWRFHSQNISHLNSVTAWFSLFILHNSAQEPETLIINSFSGKTVRRIQFIL